MKISEVLKKNAMLIVLVLVYIFFTVMTGGQMFQPLNFNALITQNAYVYILATGMLMCMLTGGNIDLSCGSFVCLLGAVGGILMVNLGMNPYLAIIIMLLVGIVYGSVLGFLIAYLTFHRGSQHLQVTLHSEDGVQLFFQLTHQQEVSHHSRSSS